MNDIFEESKRVSQILLEKIIDSQMIQLVNLRQAMMGDLSQENRTMIQKWLEVVCKACFLSMEGHLKNPDSSSGDFQRFFSDETNLSFENLTMEEEESD